MIGGCTAYLASVDVVYRAVLASEEIPVAREFFDIFRT